MFYKLGDGANEEVVKIKNKNIMHPENMVLFEHNINDDEAYDKIEKFCKEQYGVYWNRNRPPFLAMQGLPSQPPDNQ
jgi:hypothetical protein